MAVKIGHASIDENGKASGGIAGDQTKKEVCTRTWYNGKWDFLARPKDKTKAEKMATACEAGCANDLQGYDQGDRNTGLKESQKVSWDLGKITTPCEFDCSSFMTACVMAGGVKIWSGGNAPTTRTLRSVLEKSGEFEILTDEKYLTSDKYIQRADILCKEGSHTVMVLENGSKAGQEVVVSKMESPTIHYSVRLPLLKKGSKGDSVKALQILLIGNNCSCGKYGADGDFGGDTLAAVKNFQNANGLEADGAVGPKTWAKLLGV